MKYKWCHNFSTQWNSLAQCVCVCVCVEVIMCVLYVCVCGGDHAILHQYTLTLSAPPPSLSPPSLSSTLPLFHPPLSPPAKEFINMKIVYVAMLVVYNCNYWLMGSHNTMYSWWLCIGNGMHHAFLKAAVVHTNSIRHMHSLTGGHWCEVLHKDN